VLDAATAARALDVIERNASAQAQIIEDLLDVSRIVVGQFQLDVQPIGDLGPIVGAVAESFRPAAASSGIALTVRVDPMAGPIVGDPKRLQQIVWNLVSNAIKFTPPGGRVDIACTGGEDGIELRVQDTGRGIPASFLPRLFDRFSQADSTSTRVHGGLGLGLAIVRHLVELHGGVVAADSGGEGRGAAFTVRLPLAGDGSPGERARPFDPDSWSRRERAHSITGLRVLLVEDDPDGRDMLASALGASGAVVIAVADAGGALDAVLRQRPDVLVGDIGLPGSPRSR
jgi:signal transduction histidine kinase